MPFHENRTWCVVPAESAAWLAERLVEHTWTLCAGWSLGGYLFLNDATHEDGAFEVAVVKPPADEGGPWWQVESVTFGWFLPRPAGGWSDRRDYGRDAAAARRRAVALIEAYVSGAMDPGRPGNVARRIGPLDVEAPGQHGRCHHCA